MKLTALCPVFVVVLLTTPAVGQWEPARRLTFHDSTGYLSNSTQFPIAAVGDTLHLVWWDYKTGNGDLYYIRSFDNGTTWEPERCIVNDPFWQGYPSLLAIGDTLHLVWTDERNMSGRLRESDIYYMRSTDGGTTWGEQTRLTFATTGELGAYFPVMVASGCTLHLVFHDDRAGLAGDDNVFYRRSLDGGRTWGQELAIGINTGDWCPTIAVSGRFVHVAWENYWQERVTYRRSTNGGKDWLPEYEFPTPDKADSPCIAAEGQNVHLAYVDGRDNFSQFYYFRSTNNGATWAPERQISNDQAHTWSVNLWASGQYLHAVRMDMIMYVTHYTRSTDRGLTWEPDFVVSCESAIHTHHYHVITSRNTVHVVHDGYPLGGHIYNQEIYHRRNTSGNVGMFDIAHLSPATPKPLVVPSVFRTHGVLPGREQGLVSVFDPAGNRVAVQRGDQIGKGLGAGVYLVCPVDSTSPACRVVKLE
ncbi:MAG: sialidase family protein [candidate division WOR-3 bacterium]